MKNILSPRFLVPIVAFFSLTSCSIGYQIDVFVRNGAIVFVPYQLGFFGGKGKAGADVHLLSIVRLSRDTPTIWEIRGPNFNGLPLTEITYGSVPPGYTQKTAPQKLEAGQLYLATLGALGGYGDRYFVLSPYAGYAKDPKVIFLDARQVPK